MPYTYDTNEFERLLRLREAMWHQSLRAVSESLVIKERLDPQLWAEPARTAHSWYLGSLLNSAEPQEQQLRQTSAQLIEMAKPKLDTDTIAAIHQSIGQQQEEPYRAMRELDDLIGAARFYRIPSPERIPVDELRGMVADRRGRRMDYQNGVEREIRDDVFTRIAQGMTEDLEYAPAARGMMGLLASTGQETLRAVNNVVGRLPFFGDAISRSESAREADRFFSTMIEGALSDAPPEQAEIVRSVNGAIGMFPAAAVTWNALGALGLTARGAAIGSRMSPIGRGAIRGLFTDVLIQDPTRPVAEQATTAALGATFGAGAMVQGVMGRAIAGGSIGAIAGAVADDGDPQTMALGAAGGAAAFLLAPMLIARTQRSFPSRALMQRPGSGYGGGPGDDIPIAEYEVVQGLLPPGGGGAAKPINVRQAADEASNLTKQSAIIESPAIQFQSGATLLDDADVAWAITESFPGQVGVVQNVGDVGKTVRRILQEQMPNGIGPQDFRVVTRSLVPQVELTIFPPDANAGLQEIQFDVRPPSGDPLRGYAFYGPDERSLWIENFGRRRPESESIDPWAQEAAGPGWTRQFGRELLHQLDKQGMPVDILTGERVTGVRATDAITGRPNIRLSAERLKSTVPNIQTDLLISTGRPITQQMVNDYQTYGMFAGQRVRAQGQEAVLMNLGPEISVVRPAYGTEDFPIATADLLPMKSSLIVDDLPGAYESFRGFSERRLTEQAVQIGSQAPQFYSDEGASQLPSLMDEYFVSMGVDPKSAYGATLKELINHKHVEAVRSLAPIEEQQQIAVLKAEIKAMTADAPIEQLTLEELAQQRGWQMKRVIRDDLVQPTPDIVPPELRELQGFAASQGLTPVGIMPEISGEGFSMEMLADAAGMPMETFVPWYENLVAGARRDEMMRAAQTGQPFVDPTRRGVNAWKIQLVDNLSKGDVVEEFTDEAAARTFLQNFQREPIDNAPVSAFPIEALETPIGLSDEGGRLPGEWRDVPTWAEGIESAEANWFAFGGEELLQHMFGGGGGLPPGGGGPGFFGGFNEPPRLPPTGAERVGREFARLRKDSPRILNNYLERLDWFPTRILQPVRNLAMQADQMAHEYGIDFRIAPAIEDLQNKRNLVRSESFPWIQRAIEQLDVITTRKIRDGTVRELLNLRPDQMESAMSNAGFRSEERKAMREIRSLLDEFWTGPVMQHDPNIGYIEGYFPQYRQFLSQLPGDPFRTPRVEDWASGMLREEEIPLDELERDASVILSRYFHSYYKAKHMNEPYSMVKAQLSQPDVPELLRELFLETADALMWGMNTADDFMVNATHTAFDLAARSVGMRITKDQVNGFYRNLLRTSYGSALGGRLDVVIRDLPQALIPIFHVGMDRGIPILSKYLSDSAYRESIRGIGTETGALVPEHGMAFDPDLFGVSAQRPPEAGPAYDPAQLLIEIEKISQLLQMPEYVVGAPTGQQRTELSFKLRDMRRALRVEAVARAGDQITENLLKPLGLHRGWTGTWADWLRLYGAQSEHSRAIGFAVGYESAWTGLRAYDAAKNLGLGSEALEKQLLKETRVARFQGSIQDQFLNLARAGDYEGAARFFGRHTSDTQNRWGLTEAPTFWRQRGPISGRFGMQYLTFSSQRLADMTQIMRDPRIDWQDKAAYVGQIGALQGLWYTMQKLTGWNFAWYALTGAALFPAQAGGGLWKFFNLIQAGGALITTSFKSAERSSPTEQAMRGLGGAYVSEFVDPSSAMWNPWAGGIGEVQKFRESAPFGAEAIGRSIFTNESGDPQITRWQEGRYISNDPYAPLQWLGTPQQPGTGAQQ